MKLVFVSEDNKADRGGCDSKDVAVKTSVCGIVETQYRKDGMVSILTIHGRQEKKGDR